MEIIVASCRPFHDLGERPRPLEPHALRRANPFITSFAARQSQETNVTGTQLVEVDPRPASLYVRGIAINGCGSDP
jgi:hypothetical protein